MVINIAMMLTECGAKIEPIIIILVVELISISIFQSDSVKRAILRPRILAILNILRRDLLISQKLRRDPFLVVRKKNIQGCPDLYLEKFQVDFRTKSIFFGKIT